MDQSEDREEGAPPWKITHRPPTGPGPDAELKSGPGSGPSCLSMKSDSSMYEPMYFKPGCVPQTQPGPGPGPGPSCLSMKSDSSMYEPMYFKPGCVPQTQPGPGSGPSCLSMKSDSSMYEPMYFKPGCVPQTQPGPGPGPGPGPSCLSMKSDSSMYEPMYFKPGCVPQTQPGLSCVSMNSDDFMVRPMDSEPGCVSEMTEALAEHLYCRSQFVDLQRKLKHNLQQKFECVIEGIAKAGNSKTLLNQIYTELYITEGGATEVNQEHEVRQIERASRRPYRPPPTISCEDIFKTPADRHEPIRTVLTKGVAGIGKTVLTQKLGLDWSQNKAHQDIHFLFPFTFRELNVLKQQKFSLVELVHYFFTETKEAGIWIFEDLQVVFILDGLDECRPPLDFDNTQTVTDVTESASVDVLLKNLIRGNLLPSARLWITTRPAAANQIPTECVDMVTEVRGFTDPQKEEYFRKKVKKKKQANAVISHIKTSRSVHIMCHIPVFCWITAEVLEDLLKTMKRRKQLPKTLTEMYIHFLQVQAKVKNIKYDGRSETDSLWSPETRTMIQSLGKLAFEQLKKGNLIFYESDLTECGIDISLASVYSGVFTEVFKEETGLYQDQRFSFIHLSVQEFVAALHVHQTFTNTGVDLLSEEQPTSQRKSGSAETRFYQSAVDQALQCPNGHLDMFLRFLLGLSLPTNHSLLQDLMKQTGSSSQTNRETARYIEEKMNEELSVEKSINLLHCLNELEDQSLMDQIQRYLRDREVSPEKLSPAQWSALVFILLSSDKDLDQFDLNKYLPSEEGLLNLLPVVKASTKAILTVYGLSAQGCEGLSAVLTSQSCSLRHLDLDNNDLKDSGLKILSHGLRSPACKLETLSLSNCFLSERSCEDLSSVLTVQSSLIHLDLSNNDLKDPGMKILSDGLRSPHCKLETLRLSGCLITEEGCSSLVSALKSNPSHLRLLDLSYNHPGASGQKLCALVDDPHWTLDTVRLEPSGVQWLRPGLQKYSCELTLDPNTANEHLRLSENNKKVEHVEEVQSYPDHQDRFDDCDQVMCSTGLTGRCYWEVEWSGLAEIAVTYRGIDRKGFTEDCDFGRNDQSWSLWCCGGGYTACHNNLTRLPQSSPSSSGRVSVYVDCPAGSVSFYKVSSDKLIHLHTFTSTFTEPLFGGFTLYKDGSVFLCDV